MFENHIKMIREKITPLLRIKDKVLIAVDGNCGAGKSTLARELAEALDANLFHTDDFYLPLALRTDARMQEFGGNIDYARFKTEVLEAVLKGAPFKLRRFNCKAQAFYPPEQVLPKKVNIIEGSYSLQATLIAFYDFKIFMEISPAVQEKRILERNGPIGLERFKAVWIPLENRYFEALNIKESCDLVLNGEK